MHLFLYELRGTIYCSSMVQPVSLPGLGELGCLLEVAA